MSAGRLATMRLTRRCFKSSHAWSCCVTLVFSAPARVRLHPSCFIGGQQEVQEFRMKAVEVGISIGFDERSLAWQVPEVHVGQPLVATVNIGNAESPVPTSCCVWEPPAVGSTGRPAVGGHAAVLDALRGLHTNKVYLTPHQRSPWALQCSSKISCQRMVCCHFCISILTCSKLP